jgi:geranylgeranyl pyrophosphate synthase
MDKGVYTEESRFEINRRMAEHGVLESTKSVAAEFGRSARKCLAVLAETEYRSALEELPNFVVNRQK